MQGIKKIIPSSLKLFYKVSKRRCKDIFNGNYKRFALRYSNEDEFYPVIKIEQPIKATGTTLNKINNLSIAINKLNNIIIQPGEIFSFWKLVGNPSAKNGYKKSRSIINGEVDAAIGGGLCQLSGLIYFLALQGGLKITERHAHSIDIYTEEERFTPLGTDATVAYGYKDLRFINQYHFPVVLIFHLTNDSLTGNLLSKEKIAPCCIAFEYRKFDGYTEVDTIAENNEDHFIINSGRYKTLPLW